MLDLKFIRENLEAVKENIRNRNMKVDADKVALFDARNGQLHAVESLRRSNEMRKNEGKTQSDEKSCTDRGGADKGVTSLLKRAEEITRLNSEASLIPNMAHPTP